MFRDHRVRSATLTALFALPLVLAVAPRATAIETAPASHYALERCGSAPALNRSAFPASPVVTNTFLPLVPGRSSVLEGTVVGDDGQPHAHRISSIVTDLTKRMDGVRVIVVFDRDFDDGQLQESELAFLAQDTSGRVWNLGEYPEEYVDGTFTGAPSTWISGAAGARAGFAMLARPTTRSPAYLQGLAPPVGFQDCAKVIQTGQHICVPVRCYDNVLVTEEWAPNDPAGGRQQKFYAPGVGNIRVDAVGGANPEVLRLTQYTRLCGAAFGRVRSAALRQDARGYQNSGAVYSRTSTAQRTLPSC
jgi:hypothetical protein